MKRCPNCNRIYPDDNLKFCTHDGGRLVSESESAAPFDLNATIRGDVADFIPPKRPSAPPPKPEPPKPAAPSTPDLNATIAAYPPLQPPPEPRRGDTGPTSRRTTDSLSPSEATPASPPSPSAPPPPPLTSSTLPKPVYTPRPQAAPRAAPPAPKKSRLPLILGVVGLLVVLFIAGGAILFFTILKPRLWPEPVGRGVITDKKANTNNNADTGSNVNLNSNANVNVNSNESAAVNANANANSNSNLSALEPPANSRQFINSRARLDGKLAEHFVNFSFYYPKSMGLDPKSGVPGASNFVKVERNLGPDFPQERFVVSWYESGGTVESDRQKFPNLVESFSSKFSKEIPDYQKLSEGETKINSLDGYEFRFQGFSKGTPKGDVTIWGRMVFLPPGTEGNRNGVTLVMLATSLAPEVKSIDDVGVKGELPVILNSFKFGA